MTFKDFQTYLNKVKIYPQKLLKKYNFNKENWVEEVLVKEIKKKLTQIVRMGRQMLEPGKGYYEIIGMDFLLDENYKLWYLEGNRNPDLHSLHIKLKTDLILDFSNIVE